MTKGEQERVQVKRTEVKESVAAELEVVTSDKRMTLYAVKEEFEELKNSLNNLIAAFTSFLATSGLEISKSLASAKLSVLRSEFGELKNVVRANEQKMRKELANRSDLDALKDVIDAEVTARLEASVSRAELGKFKATIEAGEAKIRKDLISRSDLDALRGAIDAKVMARLEASVSRAELAKFKATVEAGEAKIRKDLISRSDLDALKDVIDAKVTARLEASVTRSELEEFKATVEARIPGDVVTQEEFDRFRKAMREVM